MCVNEHKFTTIGAAHDMRFLANSKAEQQIVKSRPTKKRPTMEGSSLAAILSTWTSDK